VLFDERALAHGADRIRGVIANAGCANACTGARGMADAEQMAALAADVVGCAPEQMLVLSTGVIGVPLDMAKLARGIATMRGPEARSGGDEGASASMNNDRKPDTASTTVALESSLATIAGFAKGSGMIHPRMATMLAVITTDAALPASSLRAALRGAADRSFNRISVDGDTSTNDTVLLLASGASRVSGTADQRVAFDRALLDVCTSLSRQIARDGEGATRLVEIVVSGAASEAEAHMVADAVARSPLVKTAIHGGDPDWGRVLAAAGISGVALDADPRPSPSARRATT
jgi:glutamate N-acetyltransferase/amino-acid N-acetyltransferase